MSITGFDDHVDHLEAFNVYFKYDTVCFIGLKISRFNLPKLTALWRHHVVKIVANAACQRGLMWKNQWLESSEDQYINVDRNRILERAGWKEGT